MEALWIAVAALAGYLLGSIPFAVIIARRHGVDILQEGSGNPGATNVKRVLGAGPGNLCFFLDAGKGFFAAFWPLLPFLAVESPVLTATIGFAAALIGHAYSVFLQFRGGKGVAVTIGGLLALMPWTILCGLVVWVVCYYATKVVAIGSLALAAALPLASAALNGFEDPRFYLALAVGLLLIVRHRSNMVRLLRGQENCFAKPSEEDKSHG